VQPARSVLSTAANNPRESARPGVPHRCRAQRIGRRVVRNGGEEGAGSLEEPSARGDPRAKQSPGIVPKLSLRSATPSKDADEAETGILGDVANHISLNDLACIGERARTCTARPVDAAKDDHVAAGS